MRSVKIEKIELLSMLVTNRDNHNDEYQEANKAYRLEVIETLSKALVDIRDEGQEVNLEFDIVEPMDMTKDYDRVIKMLKMSVDTQIELSSSEFQNYVMDDWSWSGVAAVSNSAYTSKWLR
jgi:hypothetical protein